MKRVRFMFPAQNLRSPPASALLGGSGNIPPWNNTFAERCFIVIICLKLFVHIQSEQDSEMNQMTLPYLTTGTGFGIWALAIWGKHAWSRSRNPPPPPLPTHTQHCISMSCKDNIFWNWNNKVYLGICYTTITEKNFVFSRLYRPICHWWIKFIFCKII